MTSINFNKISANTVELLRGFSPDQEKTTLEVIVHTPGYIHRFLPKNDKTVQTEFISYLFQRLEETLKDQSKTDVVELYKKGLQVCVRYAKEFFNASSTFFGESSSIELLKKSFTCRFGAKEIRLPLALLQIYKIDLIFNSTLSKLQEGQQSEMPFEEYGKKTAELFEQFIRTQSFNISINDATYDDIIEILHLHTFSNYCQFEEFEQYTADTLITILSTASNTVYWRDEVVQQVLSSNSRMCFEVLKKYLKNMDVRFEESLTKIYVDPRALVLIELPCMRFHIGGIYIQSIEEISDIIKALKTVLDTDSFKNQIQNLYCPIKDRNISGEAVDVISRLFPSLNHLKRNLGNSLTVSSPDILQMILQSIKENSKESYQRVLVFMMQPFPASFFKQFLEFLDTENMILDSKSLSHQKIVALLFSGILSQKQNSQELIRIKEINDLMIQEETEHNLLNRILLKKYELLTEVLNEEETHTLNTIKMSQLLKDLSSIVQFDHDIFNILIDNRLYEKITQISNKSEKFQFFEQIKQYLNTYMNMSLKEDPKHIHVSFCIGMISFAQSSIVEDENKLELLKQTQEAYQKVLEIEPSHLQTLYNLGYALLGQANLANKADNKFEVLEKAQNCFQKILEIDPKFLNTHFLMGNIFFERFKIASTADKLGLLEQAQNCVQKTLEIDSNFSNAYFFMGSILFERFKIVNDVDRFGLLQQAQNCYQKVLEIDSNDKDAKQSLNFILHQQGRLLFFRAVNRNVNEARKLELLKQAQETVQKILEIDPYHMEAAKFMDNIVLEQKKIIHDEATDASKKRKRKDSDTDDTSASKRSKV